MIGKELTVNPKDRVNVLSKLIAVPSMWISHHQSSCFEKRILSLVVHRVEPLGHEAQ